jgi:hypothetical protein
VTAGQAPPTYDAGTFLVPKKDLVGVLQGKRPKVAQGLENAAPLAEELRRFRLKTAPLTDEVIEWRERPHDDLVLAIGVAAWYGERHTPVGVIVVDVGVDVRPQWHSGWWPCGDRAAGAAARRRGFTVAVAAWQGVGPGPVLRRRVPAGPALPDPPAVVVEVVTSVGAGRGRPTASHPRWRS